MPRGTHTRPTSDRVREALFSMLLSRDVVVGARVLDLYAGTGALGLEALSRGAAHTTFVESDRRALEALARNVSALREGHRTRVVPSPVARAITKLEGSAFNLVLCDPPYADVPSGAVGGVLGEALAKSLITTRSTLVLEHASRDATPQLPGFRIAEQREYGDTTIAFYEIA